MMRKKVKSQKGETLIESLVSLLIATMAVLMLTAAITASARINKANQDADKKYEEELNVAEGYVENAEYVAVDKVVNFEIGGVPFATKEVELYGGSGRLASYKAK